MTLPARWWIGPTRPREQGIRRAVDWLVGRSGDAALLVEARSHLSQDDYIGEILGAAVVAQLVKGASVTLPTGARLRLLSRHGQRVAPRVLGPLLVVHPDKPLLDYADQIAGATDLLVVPWDVADVAYWIEQWSARNLDAPTTVTTAGPRLNPVVACALKTIMEFTANQPLLRGKDKPRVIEALRLLVEAGEEVVARDIRGWVARHEHGNPRLADDIAGLANDVLEGKRFPSHARCWKPDVVEVWRSHASKGG